tara:strand:- start:1951 stop:3189 length:1239 start_codon:yes stop_codon:yes gene_type:complete
MNLKTITLGLFSAITACLALWSLLPAELELARKVPAFFATISMFSMALAIFLSCRPKWIERFIGGMDKAYIWHKWLGIFGLLGASFHWMLVPGPAGNGIDPIIAEVGEESGQWAMYGLLLLGGVSMVKQIPYRIWYYTHKLMGPIFLVSIYHTFFSDVPFEVGTKTGVALVVVSLIGCISWIYKMVLKPRGYCQYRVSESVQLDDTIEVHLTPIEKGIQYQAGQFAYLDFGYDKIEHFHPFTIASEPNEDHLTFVIRKLGRHTNELYERVKPGDIVTVDGAYGQLHARKSLQQPQIWIAGGIGITPFLAWIKSLKGEHPPVHLFYVGRGKLYTQILSKLDQLLPTSQVTLYTQTEIGELLNGKFIRQQLQSELHNHQVFACGPKKMMNDLKIQLLSLGLPATQWHNENFAMR